MKTASIIMCAGMGSRFNSSKSKMLHEICGRPLSYWPVKNALDVTGMKPTVVLSHQGPAISESLTSFFDDRINFAKQDTPNGTGGAVLAAMSSLPKDCTSVLVLCGDTPLLTSQSLKKLLTIQKKSHVPVAMLSATLSDASGYGRVLRNANQQIVGIVEESDASALEREIKEVNSGVYVFDADFLRENIVLLKNNNVKQEFYLTDLVSNYIKSGHNSGPVENIEITAEEMQGVNDRRQLAFAQKVLNRRLLDHWMLAGVTFIAPQTNTIEEGVKIRPDVQIYPGVHLRGNTNIGDNCIIENGSIIKDCIIEKNCQILAYSYCEKTFIGEHCIVGPFARLRPQAHLESDVKVGNFVEIKNSRLKKGAKASHLAYLGDAEIGENANIGAGAVTCNFDGVKKHRTVIGEGAFIGSNSTLIAPLIIGEGSYVAAGSTISKQVPKGHLAFGRSRQMSKERARKII